MVLGACDHSRLVVGRQPHRLGLVELGILKRRHAEQSVPQTGMKSVLGDVDLIAQDQLQRRRKLAYQWRIGMPARGRRGPRFIFLILWRQPNPEDAPPPLCLLDDGFRLGSADRAHASEKCPLIGPRNQLLVEEHAVSHIAGALLQRKSDEVSEATLRQGVLVGKQTVVRVQAHVGPPLHGFGEEVGTEAPRQGCRDGFPEEEPDVPAAAGSRAFERRRQIETPTRVHEGEGVVLPPGFVEVDCEEEARLVEEQGIHAGDEPLAIGILAREVPANDLIGDRKEATVGTLGALDSRLLADAANPLVRASGRIPGFPGLPALEPPRVHIISTAEERPEKCDLGLG